MICYKFKEGANFCKPNFPKQWVQRIVLININNIAEEIRSKYSIFFKTKMKYMKQGGDIVRVGGVAFEYPSTFVQILGNAEAVSKFGTKYWRHNVQISLADFEHFPILEEINKSEYFAALLDFNNRIWIFGYDYGLQPEDYLYQNIEMDTLTLRGSALEENPPLLYTGNVSDFWNNFTEVSDIPEMGDFNDDFNDDFDQ